MAGYPASGKSTCLAQSVRERFPLFGKDNLAIIPELETIREVHDRSSTTAKARAGYWMTLIDMARLNKERRLPRRLILHLDLLLAYLKFRPARDPVPDLAEAVAAFARLFAQPAMRHYERYSVTTIQAPIEEIQRRWHDRHRDGFSQDSSGILAEKKRLITDGAVAASAHATIHAAWEACLASLLRSGKLANHFQARTSPRADSAAVRLGESP